MHHMLVLQGHMTFNINALISQSNWYFLSLEYTDMDRFLVS